MPNIELFFAGHFVCRLATNPDPFDEPRGRAGWTCAYPGEPDLDRRIHFDPRNGYIRNAPVPPPLQPVRIFKTIPACADFVGLTVLLDSVDGRAPCFEGRDGAVANPGAEPIVPLRVTVRKDGETLLRIDYCRTLDDRSRQQVNGGDDFGREDIDVALTTAARQLHYDWNIAITLRIAAIEQALRQQDLVGQLRTTLEARLRACRAMVGLYGRERRCQTIICALPLSVDAILTAQELCGYAPDYSEGLEWPLTLRLFGFDADALAGICVGRLTIPLATVSG